MSWVDAALWWLPTVAVAAMTGLALLAVLAQAPRPVKQAWLAGVLIVGIVAVALSGWQQATSLVSLTRETERLRDLGSRLDQLGQMLPAGSGATPTETFDSVTAAIASLNAKIRDLEEQIHVLREKARSRVLDADTAAKMAAFLRQAGSFRVVVSCAPDDVEAFSYANQLANVFRAAGWDALGPETTTIFGEAPNMGVRLIVRGGGPAGDAAKVMLDTFTRFGIPVQSGIAPNEAIPDAATVELFVSHKS